MNDKLKLFVFLVLLNALYGCFGVNDCSSGDVQSIAELGGDHKSTDRNCQCDNPSLEFEHYISKNLDSMKSIFSKIPARTLGKPRVMYVDTYGNATICTDSRIDTIIESALSRPVDNKCIFLVEKVNYK